MPDHPSDQSEEDEFSDIISDIRPSLVTHVESLRSEVGRLGGLYVDSLKKGDSAEEVAIRSDIYWQTQEAVGNLETAEDGLKRYDAMSRRTTEGVDDRACSGDVFELS
jgi:hypothetical protein